VKLSAAWSKFIAEKAPLKEATRLDYEHLYDRDIAPSLGELDQADLTPERIEAFSRELVERNLSEHRRSTVLRLLERLRRVV